MNYNTSWRRVDTVTQDDGETPNGYDVNAIIADFIPTNDGLTITVHPYSNTDIAGTVLQGMIQQWYPTEMDCKQINIKPGGKIVIANRGVNNDLPLPNGWFLVIENDSTSTNRVGVDFTLAPDGYVVIATAVPISE